MANSTMETPKRIDLHDGSLSVRYDDGFSVLIIEYNNGSHLYSLYASGNGDFAFYQDSIQIWKK